VDTDWNNIDNWADGVVPTNTVDVTIPAGRPNYPATSSPVECHKLTILIGGTVNMISSFFDVFTEVSCDDALNISGGTMHVTNNLQQAGNGVITINDGNFNIDGYWGGDVWW